MKVTIDRGHVLQLGVAALAACASRDRAAAPDADPVAAYGRAFVIDALGGSSGDPHENDPDALPWDQGGAEAVASEITAVNATPATRRVIFSHAGCVAMNRQPRNISDAALRASGNRGGVAGIHFHAVHACGRPADLRRRDPPPRARDQRQVPSNRGSVRSLRDESYGMELARRGFDQAKLARAADRGVARERRYRQRDS
ncbi:MAG TPA: membrane dipeptidase [Kofleriaceae bacterium]